jgi:amidohydrolase
MPNIDRIDAFAHELTAIRRDLHAHPEIGFEEVRTSGIVAEKLAQWGIEVHRGLGGTGVVGVLKGKGSGTKRVGLRADMDALPMEENTNLTWRSTIPGRFHGCGHDGHTTILLGTARYLAETRNFDGTVHFIFQPAEEGLGGARAMIKDGLFEKFPCDEIYGLHNAPDLSHRRLRRARRDAGTLERPGRDRACARTGIADDRQPQCLADRGCRGVDHADSFRFRL